MDCAFLVHGLGIFSTVHVPYVMPYLVKDPFMVKWYYYPFLPLALMLYCGAYFIGAVIPFGSFVLRGLSVEIWATPRLGFNYFLTCDQPRINHMIESSILEAEKKGVKVVALGALNKVRGREGGGRRERRDGGQGEGMQILGRAQERGIKGREAGEGNG